MDDFLLDGPTGLRRTLERVDARVRALEGEHHVAVEDLFPPSFMRRHTPFETLEQMLDAAGLDVEDGGDLADDAEWDRFVAAHSSFEGWGTMVETAGHAWAHRRLGFN